MPYNVYMVTTLVGRAVGDFGVRRFGAVAVVRGGAVVAAVGFAVVAGAPGAWVGMLGFMLLGLGLCVLVPQTFAAAGRLAAERDGRAGGNPTRRWRGSMSSTTSVFWSVRRWWERWGMPGAIAGPCSYRWCWCW